MAKWKLKLNSLQRMHHLCVCWLRWRMSTQSLWRLQVRWTEISPHPPPVASFLSQPACYEKCQRDKGKGCNVRELEARKSWICILCDTSVMRNWDRFLLGALFFPQQWQGCSVETPYWEFWEQIAACKALWPWLCVITTTTLALAGHQENVSSSK